MNHSSTRLSFIVFIALIAGSTHVRAQEIWCSIWSTSADRPSGMYALDASAADTAFTLLKPDSTLVANAGCCWWNNSYYVINYTMVDGRGITNYSACNVNDFKPVYTEQVTQSGYIALASGTDPATGITYGCFSSNGGFGQEWGKVNYRTLDDKVSIKTLDKMLLAVAIDAKGQAWAVDADGNLLKVDKETGEQTLVGPTGVKSATQQCADFDPNTGKLYWSVEPTGSTSGLYTIDTATGHATLVKQFAHNEYVLGMHMLKSPSPQAPARVANLAVVPDYNYGGTVKFTMPSKRVDGSDITAPYDYYIVNGVDTLSHGTAAPSQPVEWSFGFSNFLWGDQTFIVLTRNEAGFSAQARKFVNIPTTSTGVGGVKTTAVAADGAYYDLNGRRVTAPARGTIYIHNGKKVKLSR